MAALGEEVFHTNDAGSVWGIKEPNTLHTTLSRYAKRGLLWRIHKGLYSIKDPKDIDPQLLGLKAMHAPAYISCETILYEHGALNQRPREITIVSNTSRRFTLLDNSYRSKKLADKFLLNTAGIEIKNGMRFASLSRAVADMLYFSPRKYLDAMNSGLINWQEVKRISEVVIGYNMHIPENPKNYDSTR